MSTQTVTLKDRSGTFERVPIKKIKLGRNSRVDIDYQELENMMAAIKENGLLQPIGVTPSGNGYEIVYGNRRFLACSKLGWTTIPAMIKDAKQDFDRDSWNLVENIHRRNLTLTEIGRYLKILEEEGLTTAQAAVRLGLDKQYLKMAIGAFERVPKEFQDDIEVRTSPQKGITQAPGTLSLKQVHAITNFRKGAGLGMTVVEERALFKLAKKHGPKFNPDLVPAYFHNIRNGKDAFAGDATIRHIRLNLFTTEDEYDRLEKKYVIDGVMRSVADVVRAIIRGEIREKVNISQRTASQITLAQKE